MVDDSEKYSTTGQQIKTGLEGAAQGVAGPLATLAETKVLGVKPEDIRGRAEANPVIHGAGEAAGLIGGMVIPGLGEYSLASKVGEAGSAVAKLATNPITQGAIKAASEMALIQASDETSKWLQDDPNQSVQSAIANIGLSAALGGVGGAAFTKAGQAIKSLGKESPEVFVGGFKKGMDPFTGEGIEYSPKLSGERAGIDPFTKQPIEGMASRTPNNPKVESTGLGKQVAQAIKDNMPNAASEAISGGLGAALGHATGIPGAGWLGALIGEKALSPMFKSIIPAIGKKLMDMDINPMGFITAVNTSENAIKGQLLVNKAVNSVFQQGFSIPDPDKKGIDLLDAKVKAMHNDPLAAQQAINNDLAHYMPDHAMSLGQTVGQAIQYLNSIRPNAERAAPLDSNNVPNDVAKAQYNEALKIAQDPLTIINSIKDGNLTSSKIKHLASIYPALYESMKSGLMNSMVTHLSKEGEVPYKLRLNMSLFMGEPLDSSMKPMSIQASMPPPQQMPQGAPGVKNVKHSTNKLGTIASMDATPLENRELRRAQKA